MKPDKELKQVMELHMLTIGRSAWTENRIAFVSEESMMKYFQIKFPKKKRLRLMSTGTRSYLMNHNSYVFYDNLKIERINVLA